MNKVSVRLIVAALTVIMLASCGGGGGGGGGGSSGSNNAQNSTAGHTPFIISKPVCKTGAVPGLYEHCAVQFSFKNTSSKDMSHLTISCMVYSDMEGHNPFMGTNHILADFPENIASGETKMFTLDLEPYLYTIPTEPYLIDQFFVKQVTFSDGSTWKDLTGAYSVKSW